MPSYRYPPVGFPLSRAELRKELQKGPLYEFLDYQTRDMFTTFDDFGGDTINLDMYAVANGAGSGAASFAITVAEDGWIRATTGTAADDTTTCSLIGPKNYYGDRNCGIEMRVRPITAVTETRIELGFVDVVPGSNKPVVNSLTTPSVNTSVVDAALFVYDNASSTTTTELVTIGGSITAAKTAITMPTAVTAATAFTVRIQVLANRVTCWIDGARVASHDTGATDYIEGGNAVAPFALIRASNATSKSLDIDYIRTWKERN